jgi:hypothetical protein
VDRIQSLTTPTVPAPPATTERDRCPGGRLFEDCVCPGKSGSRCLTAGTTHERCEDCRQFPCRCYTADGLTALAAAVGILTTSPIAPLLQQLPTGFRQTARTPRPDGTGLPACHHCGATRGPWLPTGDRYPNGAQQLVCVRTCTPAGAR